MKTLTEQLAQYAAYHRDSRNIVTHFVGIPLIVASVTALLSRPGWEVGGVGLSPAMLVAALAVLFYLRLDLRFGAVMTLLLALCVWLGRSLAAESTVMWLAISLGLFTAGWAIQFLGHHYEGRKPAFVDDLIGLAVGPLFVVAELGFLLGLRDEVRRAVEERAGPVRQGQGASARLP